MDPETPTDDTTPETPPTDPTRATEPTSEPGVEPAISDAASEPAPPKYRVIGPRTIRREVELTTEERLVASDRACELGEKVDEIEAQIDSAKEAWRDKLKTLQAKLDTAKDAHREALRARHTGKETRRFEAEERAIIPSATVEVVLVESGEVVESRPMTEAEQAKYCRQGDIADVTGGATVPVSPTGEPTEPAPVDTDGRWDASNEQYPIGWPVAWQGCEWLVQIGDEPSKLREGDVLEVYLRTPIDGEGVTVGDTAKSIDWMQRQGITRAFELLKDKGLARKSGRRWWSVVPSSAPVAEEPEPGRADDLPEAGDITRPKLTEPATKADVVFADATDASALYGHA